jgi:hypothetical protein
MQRSALALAAAACVAAAIAALALARQDHHAARGPAIRLDERTGTFLGLRLGRSEEKVVGQFGAGLRGKQGRAPAPVGTDPTAISGPTSEPSEWTTRRYQKLVVQFDGGRVVAFATTSPRARTRAGVGLGDRLTAVKTYYTGVRCDHASLGESDVSVPYCAGRLPSGGGIWFGGDPIRSIWVLEGLGSQLPRHGLMRERR